MDKEYKTVLNFAQSETEEKKSRFIASVKPVSSEEEALAFISQLKSKYWDATHNVYSYYIGGNNIVQRFSDDGEPSGTAGMPILEIIKRMEVRDLVVVSTRYFGGTLLGAAGLIRAYSKSASTGIEAAQVITKKLCKKVKLTVEYTMFGKVQSLLASHGFIIKDTIYAQDVEIIVFVPIDEVDGFTGLITEATNARALMETGDNVYITLDLKGKLITTE
ncbi:MAG: YigZ family protein [Clostridiaceae bacterium]|nr:YigZ family protein [Clostridiaceae bacterium]